MKLRIAVVLGLVAISGVGLWLLMKQPEPAPPASAGPATVAKPKVVNQALPARPDVSPESARADTLAALPHPESAVPTAPVVKATTPVPASRAPAAHPDVVKLGARADYLVDLDNVRLMLRDYRSVMGENPVGSNAEIMKSIMGGNPKHAQLGPTGGQGINASGELVDRWGTAYFFHQISATNMEIRSAGPDKIMWTADDVVLR